jgi:hypothetical protein
MGGDAGDRRGISVTELLFTACGGACQCLGPDGSFYLDILTRLGEAFAFDDLEVVRVPLDGVTASVVSPRTL